MSALPMFVPVDGNDRNRKVAARDAAPVRGSYICNDFAATKCPDRPTSAGSGLEWGCAHCWHESTARRLEWQGGPSAGADADLAAWNRLGGQS